jgi:hypothetical protein
VAPPFLPLLFSFLFLLGFRFTYLADWRMEEMLREARSQVADGTVVEAAYRDSMTMHLEFSENP